MNNPQPRILLHAHVFHAAIWPEIRQCIENFRAVVGDDALTVVLTHSLTDIPPPPTHTREAIAVPNRGYDIAPFLTQVLNRYNLDEYDYIVKLHTKRDVDCWLNYRLYRGSEWRRRLLAFCSTEQAVRQSIAAFAKYPRLGMISNSSLISYGGAYYITDDIRREKAFVRALGLHPKAAVFVPGTIFMVRAQLMKPFVNRYTTDDFPPITDPNAHALGLAHQLEGPLAAAVLAQGFVVSAGRYPPKIAAFGYYLRTFLFRILRALSSCTRHLLTDRLFTRLVTRASA